MHPPYDSPSELEAFDAKPAALAVVENYFYTDGRECADCAHCKSWIEPHGEHCNSCAVVEGSALPSACPAWESKHITIDEEN